jgi:hypothetical protein
VRRASGAARRRLDLNMARFGNAAQAQALVLCGEPSWSRPPGWQTSPITRIVCRGCSIRVHYRVYARCIDGENERW